MTRYLGIDYAANKIFKRHLWAVRSTTRIPLGFSLAIRFVLAKFWENAALFSLRIRYWIPLFVFLCFLFLQDCNANRYEHEGGVGFFGICNICFVVIGTTGSFSMDSLKLPRLNRMLSISFQKSCDIPGMYDELTSSWLNCRLKNSASTSTELNSLTQVCHTSDCKTTNTGTNSSHHHNYNISTWI